MNKFFLFLTLFLLINVSTLQTDQLKIFDLTKAPQPEGVKVRTKKYSKTRKMLRSPLMIRIEKFKKESPLTDFFEYFNRIQIINPTKYYFNDLFICIEYFYFDVKDKFSSKAMPKPYTIKIYIIESLGANSKKIIETPSILYAPRRLAYSGRNFFIYPKYDSSIISFFYKDKLLYQAIDSSKLLNKGISELTQEIKDKFMVDAFVPSYGISP